MLEVNNEKNILIHNTKNILILPYSGNLKVSNCLENSEINLDIIKENKQVHNKNNKSNVTGFNHSDISLIDTNRGLFQLNKKLNSNKKIKKVIKNNYKKAFINKKIKSSNVHLGVKAVENQEKTNLTKIINEDARAKENAALKRIKITKKNRGKEICKVDKTKTNKVSGSERKQDSSCVNAVDSSRVLLRNDRINAVNNHKNLNNKRTRPAAVKNLKSVKIYNNTNDKLSIANEIEVHLKGKKAVIKTPKRFILNIANRSFLFPCRVLSRFSSKTVSIIEVSLFSYLTHLIKIYLKIILLSTLFLILWLFIAVFVESIYKNYGNNVFKIAVMPLISMLFVKFVIVVNIKLLIATILLYFKGREYLNNKKNNLLIKIIFKAFVSPLALNHFSAIMSYQNFCELKRQYLK